MVHAETRGWWPGEQPVGNETDTEKKESELEGRGRTKDNPGKSKGRVKRQKFDQRARGEGAKILVRSVHNELSGNMHSSSADHGSSLSPVWASGETRRPAPRHVELGGSPSPVWASGVSPRSATSKNIKAYNSGLWRGGQGRRRVDKLAEEKDDCCKTAVEDAVSPSDWQGWGWVAGWRPVYSRPRLATVW